MINTSWLRKVRKLNTTFISTWKTPRDNRPTLLFQITRWFNMSNPLRSSLSKSLWTLLCTGWSGTTHAAEKSSAQTWTSLIVWRYLWRVSPQVSLKLHLPLIKYCVSVTLLWINSLPKDLSNLRKKMRRKFHFLLHINMVFGKPPWLVYFHSSTNADYFAVVKGN